MLWWLSQHLLVTAGLAAVVALACRLGRLSPALRHALWVVVLVKLLVPPLFALPWPDLAPTASALPAPTAELQPVLKDLPVRSPIEPPAASQPQPSFRSPPFATKEPSPRPVPADGLTVPASAASTMAASTTAEVITQPGWSSTEIAWLVGLMAWAFGSLLVTGWHALRIARFQRRIAVGQSCATLVEAARA